MRIFILITVIFFAACSNNNNKQEKNDTEIKTGTTKNISTKPDTDYNIIATDVCDCISDFENSLSDDAKEAVLDAAKNGGIDTVWKTFGEDDRNNYFSEGKKAFDCLKNLEKKYSFFTSYTPESLKEYRKVVEENCSEFAAAWAP